MLVTLGGATWLAHSRTGCSALDKGVYWGAKCIIFATFTRSSININQLEKEALSFVIDSWCKQTEGRYKIRDPPQSLIRLATISTFPLWSLMGKTVECPSKPCTKKFFHPPNGNIAPNSNTKLCTVVLGKTWKACVWSNPGDAALDATWLIKSIDSSAFVWNVVLNDSYE